MASMFFQQTTPQKETYRNPLLMKCQLNINLCPHKPLNPASSSSSLLQEHMGRKCLTRISGLCTKRACMNRVSTPIRVRSSGQIISRTGPRRRFSGKDDKLPGDRKKPSYVHGRRILIVVDSSFEAKCALQWALSHAVQSQDVVVLLSVTKPSKQGEASPKNYELLYSMKNLCHVKRPEIQVEILLVRGKEKGPTIVEEAKKQGTTLLVLGQKRRSLTWWLLMAWAGTNMGAGGVVEHCIQNATCLTIAVRRRSNRLGGYLITTKQHKNFWLLA